MNIAWECVTFNALDVHTLYQLMKLRVDVFVVEQQCPYAELDGLDTAPETRHLLGRAADGEPLGGYLRILPPGLIYPEVGMGRFVISPDWRGRGAGHAMMTRALSEIAQCWPGRHIRIGAQVYLKRFYELHGFQTISRDYVEDGIPHVDMRRMHTAGCRADALP